MKTPNILNTLARFAGGKGAAAALVGISRQTYYNHLLCANLGTPVPRTLEMAAHSALTKLMADAQAELDQIPTHVPDVKVKP